MIVKDTLENRVSAEGRAAFEGFLTSLQHRTVGSLKVLHVHRMSVTFVCCDLNVMGSTLPKLGGAIEQQLLVSSPDAIIETASRFWWWHFWCGDLIGRGAAYFPKAPRDRYLLMIRGAVQPEDVEVLPSSSVMIGEPF